MKEMQLIGETRENWLCYLDQNGDYTFLVLVEEEPARRAYALYREGRVLEAAQVLKKAVAVVYEVPEEIWGDLAHAFPNRAWRAKGLPLGKKYIFNERSGEAVILLRGEAHEKTKLPVGVLSYIGWGPWACTEFHYTLTIDEKFLATESIEGPLE
jgi:hypothetical protein